MNEALQRRGGRGAFEVAGPAVTRHFVPATQKRESLLLRAGDGGGAPGVPVGWDAVAGGEENGRAGRVGREAGDAAEVARGGSGHSVRDGVDDQRRRLRSLQPTQRHTGPDGHHPACDAGGGPMLNERGAVLV